MKSIKYFLMVMGLFLFLTSCEDYLEVPLPVDQLATESVFKSKPAIESTVIGVYSAAASLFVAWDFGYTLYLSDELYYPSVAGSRNLLAIASIDETSTQVTSWSHYFGTIDRANVLIENLPKVADNVLSTEERNKFMGEAKYLRALAYWFMVNFWGEVPLVLTSNLDESINLPRAPISDVYAQIIKDLEDAVALLPTTVSSPSSRINNKFQAEALLARVYLYRGLWSEAETAANNVITQSDYYELLPNLTDVFKRDSKESIFSVREITTSSLFLNKALFGAYNLLDRNCALYPDILEKFESNDTRLTEWTATALGTTNVQPFKYIHSLFANGSANPQDFVFQRFAELYLIRAEARAHLNKLTGDDGAIADINTIRARASLEVTSAVGQSDVLAAIEDERIRELFGEGHRWFDLKRTEKADLILGALPHKAANYKPYMKFMPISIRELDSNTALLQTTGYPK